MTSVQNPVPRDPVTSNLCSQNWVAEKTSNRVATP